MRTSTTSNSVRLPLAARRRIRHDAPPLWFVMFEVLPARDPAEDHRFRDPPFLGTDREVDVGHDEADERDAGQTMGHVRHTPGRVAQQIWVSCEKWGSHPRHHE